MAKRLVEIRSRSGGSYSRGGLRWSTSWTEIPKDVLRNDELMKLLAADPLLEIREDGKYVTGPRAKAEGEAQPSPIDDGKTAGLRDTIRELNARLEAGDADLSAALKDLAEKDAALATALAELAAAKTSLATLTTELEAAKAAAIAPSPEPTKSEETSKSKSKG